MGCFLMYLGFVCSGKKFLWHNYIFLLFPILITFNIQQMFIVCASVYNILLLVSYLVCRKIHFAASLKSIRIMWLVLVNQIWNKMKNATSVLGLWKLALELYRISHSFLQEWRRPWTSVGTAKGHCVEQGIALYPNLYVSTFVEPIVWAKDKLLLY